ncbi:MAG: hypothetical protein HFF52_00765 [Lawsonibacter sp.]|nr:hypothetical protein [Lawsonibacter sp.]
MFNMLRMDLRRLLKSRSFKVILLVTAGMVLMVSLMTALVSDPENLEDMAARGAEIEEIDRQMSEEIRNMTQLNLAHETLGGGFLLIIVGIGVTLFVHGDFSSGFVKNICCAQPRRSGYVLSKVLIAGVYSGIITLLGILLILLAPYLFGMHPVPNTIPDILQYMLWMWLPHWAFGAMALFVVLLTRSSNLGLLASLASGLGLTAAVSEVLPRLLHLPYPSPYFLSSVVRNQCLPQPYPSQMWMVFLCSVAWAVVYGVGSLLLMEKRDI